LSGFITGFGVVAFVGALLSFIAVRYSIPDPSAALFRDLAQIGVGLLVAFSIAVAGAGFRADDDPNARLNWLSVGSGFGLTGLLGVGISVALAAYREADHRGALDQIGLGFVSAALMMLGLIVALLPYAAFYWKPQAPHE
jgi:hypothetical protein